MSRRRKTPRRESTGSPIMDLSTDMFISGEPSGSTSTSWHRRTEERAVIIASIASDEQRAAELKVKLDALQFEYDILSGSIHSKRYSLAPVGTLPPELMGEIFEQVVIENELASLTISQVCRQWRRMIRSTPRVWNTIHIRLTRRDPVALAKLYFELSRACSLHVVLTDPPLDWKFNPPARAVEPFVELFRAHWYKIRIFRIYRMGGKVASAFLQGCVPTSPDESPDASQSSDSFLASPSPSVQATARPIVRHIALNLLPNHILNEDSDMADFRSLHNLFGDAHEVTTFTMENGIPSYNMPLFTSGKLKSIQIDEPHMFSYSTPIDRILEILACSPELHVFLLAGNKSNRDRTMVMERPQIHLPLLRILSLQSIDIPLILSHLVCPSLEKLKLGNELGARWEGCIATSLRSMIVRSNYPPITRLRINEIATPSISANNEWACFDVLPHLQSFRCHHTHFPDELLRMLNSFDDDSDEDEDVEEAEEKSTSSKAIVCPRLSKLVFENCDFAGDALTQFVVGRKERAKKHKDVAELQELWVGQCPNMRNRHLEVLSRLLGSKFQSTLLSQDVLI